jgi:hypothetical protein
MSGFIKFSDFIQLPSIFLDGLYGVFNDQYLASAISIAAMVFIYCIVEIIEHLKLNRETPDD